MIVVYESSIEFLRIDEANSIHIIDVEKENSYVRESIEIVKGKSRELEKESVLLKDLSFDKIRRFYNIIFSNEIHQKKGYKYIIVITTSESVTYTLPIKKLGDPKAIEILLNATNPIKFIKILEEEGIVDVRVKE